MSLGSWVAAPLYVVLCLAACFVAALPVCAYIAKKRGPEGLRAFAEVVRAFWDGNPELRAGPAQRKTRRAHPSLAGRFAPCAESSS